MSLTPKQLKFCDLYHQTGNATRSYIEAGYEIKNEKVAEASASRLLLNVKVREYLEGLQKAASAKINVTTEKIMQEAAKIAFADLNEIVEVIDGTLVLKEAQDLNQLDGVSATKSVSESSSSGKNGESSSSSVSNSFSIKRADRLKALDMLARMIGSYERRESDNSRILRDNAPRVLETLKRYRDRAKPVNDKPGEVE
jgi:phage terminase small subunit